MDKHLKGLITRRDKLDREIMLRLDALGEDECNCDSQEEVLYIQYNGQGDYGLERRCGCCGGVIWNREL
jgi:hypothetical protein